MDKKESNMSIAKMLTVAGVLFVLTVISIAIGVAPMGFRGEGEPTPDVTQKGNITCKSWNDAPDEYQQYFTDAANQFGIQPALVGAIFLAEHGGRWATAPWATSTAGAQGPFQFTRKTWKGYGKGGNIQNIKDASIGASNYLSQILIKQVHAKADTTKDQDIKGVAVAYNGGPGYYQKWRDSGYNDSKLDQRYVGYKDDALKYFKDLSAGCESNSVENASKFKNLAQVKTYFGTTPEQIKNHLETVSFMGQNITVNKIMTGDLKKVETTLKKTNYKITSVGAYDFRANVNDPGNISSHAFGLAIDINSSTNPNVTRPAGSKEGDSSACKHDIPDSVVKAFEDNHFFWGAKFKDICDPMHFQYGGNW